MAFSWSTEVLCVARYIQKACPTMTNEDCWKLARAGAVSFLTSHNGDLTPCMDADRSCTWHCCERCRGVLLCWLNIHLWPSTRKGAGGISGHM
jgi:hypothetical protein